jgi:hypothetical protein
MKSIQIILVSSIPFILGLIVGIVSWVMLTQKTISNDILGAMIFYMIPPYVFIILPMYFGLKYLVIKIFKSLRGGIFFIGCVLIAFLQVIILAIVLDGSMHEAILSLSFIIIGVSYSILVLFFERKSKIAKEQ